MQGDLSWVCKKEDNQGNRAINEMGEPFDDSEYPSWWQFIREYSGRLLTYEKDRLIALEGLAKEMQKSGKGKYCFGVWSDKLPELLLWGTSSMERNKCLNDAPS
jgi:hypothetical protein